jgi:hypothetical protein
MSYHTARGQTELTIMSLSTVTVITAILHTQPASTMSLKFVFPLHFTLPYFTQESWVVPT